MKKNKSENEHCINVCYFPQDPRTLHGGESKIVTKMFGFY